MVPHICLLLADVDSLINCPTSRKPGEMWGTRQEYGITHKIETIFEDGDFERGKFIDLMRVEGMEAPTFKQKDDYAGLQLADLIAWEQSRNLKTELATGNAHPRLSFWRVLAVPHIHLEVTADALIHICEKKGVKPKEGTH